jgi:hypothetical protein
MKRNSPPSRASLPPHFASIGARKIFVIKRASSLQTSTTKSTIIQRILIFDDHPESLRLVFRNLGSSPVDGTAPQSPRWWEPILGWLLIVCALLVLVLPLFLKLPS